MFGNEKSRKKSTAILQIQAAWTYNVLSDSEKAELNNRLKSAHNYGQSIKIFENYLTELNYSPFEWGKEGYRRT